MFNTVTVGNINIAGNLPFVLIAGPCVIEGREHCLKIAGLISEITQKLEIPWIFKSSFDKANRTSINSYRGVSLEEGLDILACVKDTYQCPILTDVHAPEQCAKLASVVDVLQIPAFLCRQTDLLVAAANTGKAVNVKKGQFLAPWDVTNIVKKLEESATKRILLCERGSSFGYNTLVNDMRSLPIMAETGYPVIFDATHSVQQPGGRGNSSGGQRRFVPTLAKAAIAAGVAGVFMEVHDNPDNAPSDGPNMLPIYELTALLTTLKELDNIVK